MIWIAPSEKDTGTAALEKRLRDAAEQAVPALSSRLKSQEYFAPVLGLIFLRFTEVRFAAQRAKLGNTSASSRPRSPVAKQIHTLQRQIHCFRRTRDLLLPRLLSGH